jgi:oligopeptide/dipeptide ABC transporter ATP-binding protein
MTKLLEVRDLVVEFRFRRGTIRAVDGLDLDLEAGGTLGIVGESGSGKSMTSLAMLRLLPQPNGHVARGRILFEGRDLLTLKLDQMPEIRGRDIAMIFQEPMSALNPVMPVGDQIAEALHLHERIGRRDADARVIEMLELVGIPAPAERARSFIHQLSGGMRQRVMIAMALICRPRLLIADEPTTALDVTIQAQVLDLLKRLRRDLGTAILIISHDMGVIADIADRVVVMYGGRVMETADCATLFRTPRHPYTKGLLAAIPRLRDDRRRLHQIPGSVRPAGPPRPGCPFAPRCDIARPICTEQDPPRIALGEGHMAACWAVAEGAS